MIASALSAAVLMLAQQSGPAHPADPAKSEALRTCTAVFGAAVFDNNRSTECRVEAIDGRDQKVTIKYTGFDGNGGRQSVILHPDGSTEKVESVVLPGNGTPPEDIFAYCVRAFKDSALLPGRDCHVEWLANGDRSITMPFKNNDGGHGESHAVMHANGTITEMSSSYVSQPLSQPAQAEAAPQPAAPR